jgi:hypothetical protein
MAETIPAGRLAPAAWLLTDMGVHGVDVGWCETGDRDSYRSCGGFVDRASALAGLTAMEAESVPSAKMALAAAGFAHEPGKGLQAGPAPLVMRRDGKAHAWITYDVSANLFVPGPDPSSPVEVAAIGVPHRDPARPCSLTSGRSEPDLCIAAALAAWRAHDAARRSGIR